MENTRDLQTQARNFERGGQHAAALELYGRILEDPSGDREGGIWARVGHMHLALGQDEQAADSYATAVDRYAAAGLPNLALSYCQHLLRIDDSRPEILLRFGQLSAASGYTRDARHGYVEYADRVATAGDDDAAVTALREYLKRFPDDAAVRRRISELTGTEEPEEAVPSAESIQLAEGALPGLMPTTHAEPPRAADHAGGLLATTPPPSDATPPAGGAAAAGAYDAVEPLEGFEPTHADQGSEDGTSRAGFDDDPPPVHRWGDGGLGEEREAAPKQEYADAGVVDEPGGPTDDESDASGDDEEAEPLPLLQLDPEPVDRSSGDPLRNARDRVASDPGSLAARRDLIALLGARGDPGLGKALIDAEQEFSARSRAPEALEFVEQLARLQPGDTPLQQRRVERALRAGDRRATIEAYHALAARFEADLDMVRAQDCLRHVLDLDPANEEARAGLASATAASRPPQDYIDLGDLILSDAPNEVTRFQVAIGDPTGNEESDFAEILDLFRKKVSESLDPKDAASHYDLGLAFKEMGLLEDAIVHLQSALRGGANPLATLEMLGQCFVLKGQLSLAGRVFERATRLDGVGDSDLVGVLYGLARCQQDLGKHEDAMSNFERVVAVDLSFRDAAERMEDLASG